MFQKYFELCTFEQCIYRSEDETFIIMSCSQRTGAGLRARPLMENSGWVQSMYMYH